MKKILLVAVSLFCLVTLLGPVTAHAQGNVGGAAGDALQTEQTEEAIKDAAAQIGGCKPTTNFFGLPTWYKYLPGEIDSVTGKCAPVLKNISQIWVIALAIVEILMRVGGMVAVGYIMYGGFRYMTSRGEPENTAEAKNTIMNAVIGLVIVIISVTVVNFVGNRINP